jgi:lipoprotein-anchoring transpeptidase ErfK/SrfK
MKQLTLKQLTILIAAILSVLALLGTIFLLAYDATRSDRIAAGVRVGGIYVGGMTADQARKKLQLMMLKPLDRPVVVRFDEKQFMLSPEKARVSANLSGMVNAAVERSREGSIFTRVKRDLTAGAINVNMPAQISYSKASVNAFVKQVAKDLDRPAVDASIKLSPNGLTKVQSREGRGVRVKTLKRNVETQLVNIDSTRTVSAQTEVVKPKVATADLKEKYPYVIIVNRTTNQVRLYRNLALSRTYKVAVGQAGYETPAGTFSIQTKQKDPVWSVPRSGWAGKLAGTTIPGGSPQNPLKKRWLGFNGSVGFHGTDSGVGAPASHGCVRMRIPDIIELYDLVPLGTQVMVA